MYYIYILKSQAADISYVGYSETPFERLVQHNTKEHSTFSSKYKPWVMMALFETTSKTAAIEMERFIKRQKSKILISKLIDPDFIPEGKLTRLVRVPHVRD
jgi:putative endonuclease